MQARFLLDTNICIYIQRQRPPEVLARFQEIEPGRAVISAITWGELLYGAQKSRQKESVCRLLEEFVSFVPVLAMSDKVGAAYGRIRAALEAKGRPIGNNDLWIAAHAVTEHLILVTNDEGEFGRVPGLKVQNWTH